VTVSLKPSLQDTDLEWPIYYTYLSWKELSSSLAFEFYTQFPPCMLLLVKVSPQKAVETHRDVRCRDSHFSIQWTQMAMRLSVLRAGRALRPRKIPGTNFSQRLSRPQGRSAAVIIG
jgi:hypothetical protein